jgi:hypothetical protein
MSAVVISAHRAEMSPRLKARLAGVFYVIPASIFGQFIVLGRIVVPGNAAATAANILANEPLFWAGFASALIWVACQVVLATLFYDLFKPVNRTISLLAAFFLLMECAVLAFASLFQVAPMLVLKGAGYLSVFQTAQLQALALLFLNLNTQLFNISLVFFGFFCLLIGYLIFRSTFLPGILGVLYALAGLGYLTYLVPPLANNLYPFNLVPAAFGEPALILWLLIVGVNVQRWKQQASTAAEAALHV